METVAVVLSVADDRVDEFEQGFREHELPIWQDFNARGVMLTASLSQMEISSSSVDGATQYLIVVLFATGEGHHEHDNDPRFAAWNRGPTNISSRRNGLRRRDDPPRRPAGAGSGLTEKARSSRQSGHVLS